MKLIKSMLTVIFIFGIVKATYAQDSLNVRFVGGCSIPGHPMNVEISNEYVYVAADNSGLRIIDVSNPSNPVEVGSWVPSSPDWGYIHGVAVSDTIAYLGDERGKFRVINISDPSNPYQMGYCNTDDNAFDVAISGTYAYVANSWDGLCVIDISDPSNPHVVANCNAQIAVAIAVSDTFAYLCLTAAKKEKRGAGFKVVNISDPLNPYIVGTWIAFDPFCWDIVVADSLAYVADDEAGLWIVNVSDPSNPQDIGHYNTPYEVRGVALSGSYAYLTDYHGGFRVIDVSDPSSPQEVGYYIATGTLADRIAASGSYGYVGDCSLGFQIYQFLDNEPPQITVVSPNGGESFVVGDTCDITWIATDNFGVDSINIFYSTNTGISWDTITAGEPNDSLYEWIIPNTPSDSCLVKILAYDLSLNIGEDESDSLFRISSGVGIEEDISLVSYATMQSVPNPFKSKTTICYSLHLKSFVNLKIYDVTGRLVKTLVDKKEKAGIHSVIWHGNDDSGKKLSSGVYFLRFKAGNHHSTKKLLRLQRGLTKEGKR